MTFMEKTWDSDLPIPLKTFVSQVKWPTELALRSMVQRAKEKGLENAFVRVGRRVLVRPKTFFKLINDPARIQKSSK